jgi:tRNA threonylcarbamoyladenosine biosynthesis protein TsaE
VTPSFRAVRKISNSSQDTKKLGSEFARHILKNPSKSRAAVVALSGELGAGKTTFIQGFFKGLGVKKRAASPTFIIMRRVGLRKKHFRSIFHIDAYRIKKDADLLSLGFGDIVKHPENIILIEWADNVQKIIPRGAMWIRFKHGKKENERIITL